MAVLMRGACQRTIARLFADQSDSSGIAVPGMPIGSPGIDVVGTARQPFDVIAFTRMGGTSVYVFYLSILSEIDDWSISLRIDG